MNYKELKVYKPNTSKRRKPCNAHQSVEVYECLWLLNQHCADLVGMLHNLADRKLLPKREAKYFGLMVEEVRASSSQWVIESLDIQEINAAANVSERRLALEKGLLGA